MSRYIQKSLNLFILVGFSNVGWLGCRLWIEVSFNNASFCPIQVKLTLSQKDAQLESFQREHLELMKQLTATQENLQTKEQALNQLEARYQELQAQLEELQTDATAKEETLQYLQNEKIVLEVALQAARAEKSELDEGAERLGEGVLVASDTLDQLRQEVQIKATQVSGL